MTNTGNIELLNVVLINTYVIELFISVCDSTLYHSNREPQLFSYISYHFLFINVKKTKRNKTSRI